MFILTIGIVIFIRKRILKSRGLLVLESPSNSTPDLMEPATNLVIDPFQLPSPIKPTESPVSGSMVILNQWEESFAQTEENSVVLSSTSTAASWREGTSVPPTYSSGRTYDLEPIYYRDAEQFEFPPSYNEVGPSVR